MPPEESKPPPYKAGYRPEVSLRPPHPVRSILVHCYGIADALPTRLQSEINISAPNGMPAD